MKIVTILKHDLSVPHFLGLQEKQCFLCDTKCKKGKCSAFNTCAHCLAVASLVHMQVFRGCHSFMVYVVTDTHAGLCPIRIWPLILALE